MLIELLKEEREFSSAEKAIARYALAYPEKVQDMSASDLADASYTSKASVFRFLAKIGVSGFPEFKSRLAREIDEARRLSHLMDKEPFSQETTMQEALKTLPAFFESVIYYSALMQNVHWLKKAGSIL